jgi:hypothetical protein
MGQWVKALPRTGQQGASALFAWEEEAAEARTQPGEWRLIAEQVSPSHAMAIKEGRKVAFRPPDHWLVMTRNGSRLGRRLCDIYVSYIGVPGARQKALSVPGIPKEVGR